MADYRLGPDERPIAAATISLLPALPSAILAVAGAVLAAAYVGHSRGGSPLGTAGLAVAVIAGVVALTHLVEARTTRYICTDRRMLAISGVLTSQSREMPLGKVESLSLTRSPLGRVLGYGTIVYRGSGGTRRECRHICDPREFYNQIQEQVAAAQKAAPR